MKAICDLRKRCIAALFIASLLIGDAIAAGTPMYSNDVAPQQVLLAQNEKHSDGIQLLITQPANDEVIFDNEGRMEVSVTTSPPLGLNENVHLRFLLDGAPMVESKESHIPLTGIDRGTHAIQVEAINNDNGVLASSPPVTFHMWHASRLFPGHHR